MLLSFVGFKVVAVCRWYDPSPFKLFSHSFPFIHYVKKVQVGKDQEKAQSEKDSHSKTRDGKKTTPRIRYLYHETYRKPNEQLFSQ